MKHKYTQEDIAEFLAEDKYFADEDGEWVITLRDAWAEGIIRQQQEENKRLREALEIIGDEDRAAAGTILTGEIIDGYPVVRQASEIAKQALAATDNKDGE